MILIRAIYPNSVFLSGFSRAGDAKLDGLGPPGWGRFVLGRVAFGCEAGRLSY
jgi:hypothetical protein